MILKMCNTDNYLSKVCRLCLYQGCESNIIPIYNYTQIDLPKTIKECVSLEVDVNDKFPTVICSSCLEHLNQWASFRDMCRTSNNILLQSVNNSLILSSNRLILKIIKNEQNIHLNDEHKNERNDVFNSPKVDSPENSLSCSSPVCNINKKSKRRVVRKCGVRVRKKLKTISKKKKVSRINNSDINDSIIDDTPEALEKYLHLLQHEDSELKIRNEITKEHIYQCDICQTSFTSVFDYLDHQETHDGEPVFQCNKCPQIFSTRKDLVEHDGRHQVPCPKCGKLILPGCMKVHLVLHTDKYKCSECNWCFSNSTVLRHHIESVHIRLKTHVCETCGKSFTSTTSLQTHIKIHSDVRPYACKICEYTGRTASALYTHMARHENGLRVCDVCAKSFKSFRSLRDHTRRVHSEKKNHECGFCQKKFVDKYMLTVHTRTHTGARPYQCKFCDRAFVRSDGLREHLATHGQRASYNCEQCGKKFIYRRSLGRHTCVAVIN